jgi:hypothetical protein
MLPETPVLESGPELSFADAQTCAEDLHVHDREPIQSSEAHVESAMPEIIRLFDTPQPLPETEHATPVEHSASPEPTVFAQYVASAAHFDLHEPPAAASTRGSELEATSPKPTPIEPLHVAPSLLSVRNPEAPIADANRDPNISRQRLAFRGAPSRVKVEHEEEPKRGWVHRIFRRDPQVVYSIIPDDDSEDEVPAYRSEIDANGRAMDPVSSTYVQNSIVQHPVVHQPVSPDDIPTAEIPAVTPDVLRAYEAEAIEPAPRKFTSVLANLLPTQVHGAVVEPATHVGETSLSEPLPAPHFDLQPHAEELAETLPQVAPYLPVPERETWGTPYLSGDAITQPFASVANDEPVTPQAFEPSSFSEMEDETKSVMIEPAADPAPIISEDFAHLHAETFAVSEQERMRELDNTVLAAEHAQPEPAHRLFEPANIESVEPELAAEVQEIEPIAVSSVAPIVEDPAPLVAMETPTAPEPAVEHEVSMPLVPMSSDFQEPSYEALAKVARWRWDPLDPEEAIVAEEPVHAVEADLYSVYRTGEHRIAYEPAASLEKVTVPAEPEPVVEQPRPAAGRRFHLLHHFDRPIVIRGEARESKEPTYGGTR